MRKLIVPGATIFRGKTGKIIVPGALILSGNGDIVTPNRPIAGGVKAGTDLSLIFQAEYKYGNISYVNPDNIINIVSVTDLGDNSKEILFDSDILDTDIVHISTNDYSGATINEPKILKTDINKLQFTTFRFLSNVFEVSDYEVFINIYRIV